MAKAGNKVSTFLNLAMILSLLVLVITIAESRPLHPRFGNFKRNLMRSAAVRNLQKKQMINGGEKASTGTVAKLTCKTLVGVAEGDTCFGIAKTHKLSSSAFASVNPNLNCDALFVGQWVCTEGKEVTDTYRKFR